MHAKIWNSLFFWNKSKCQIKVPYFQLFYAKVTNFWKMILKKMKNRIAILINRIPILCKMSQARSTSVMNDESF